MSGNFVRAHCGAAGTTDRALHREDPFDESLLRLLTKRGLPLYVDGVAGGAEAERGGRLRRAPR